MTDRTGPTPRRSPSSEFAVAEVDRLRAERDQLRADRARDQLQLERQDRELASLTKTIDDFNRHHEAKVCELKRQHEIELRALRRRLAETEEALRRGQRRADALAEELATAIGRGKK